MTMRWALCCTVLLAFTTSSGAADKPVPKKPAKAAAKAAPASASRAVPKTASKAAPKTAAKAGRKPASKAVAKSPAKAAPKMASKPEPKPVTKKAASTVARPIASATSKPAPSSVPRTFAASYQPFVEPPAALKGKTETLTCIDGTEDRHARIGVVTIGGKVDSFAYYSKWKPRTCSIYLRRTADPQSRWLDKGSVTNVNLERGLFMIEHKKNEYRFVFRDVDRERYCGMEGAINGTLTIRKGSELCEVAGIMEEGVPLGEAYAHAAKAAPDAAVARTAPEATPPKRVARRQREPESPFPSAAEGVSD